MPKRLEELGLDLVQRLRHDRSPEDYKLSMFERLKNLSNTATARMASSQAPGSAETTKPVLAGPAQQDGRHRGAQKVGTPAAFVPSPPPPPPPHLGFPLTTRFPPSPTPNPQPP